MKLMDREQFLYTLLETVDEMIKNIEDRENEGEQDLDIMKDLVEQLKVEIEASV